MKNALLYYSPSKSGENIRDIIATIKGGGFKCIFSESDAELMSKLPKSRAIIYKSIESINSTLINISQEDSYNFIHYDTGAQDIAPPFVHCYNSKDTIIKENCILVEESNLNKFITASHHRKEITDLKQDDLYCFFDYINMYPINLSHILLKHILFYMIENNLNKCSFGIINFACTLIGLNANIEKPMLTRNIKKWYSKNKLIFNRLYPDVKISSFSALSFINTLKKCYDLKRHKNVSSKIFLLRHKIDDMIKRDQEILNGFMIL